jgi:hypothetical protein
MHMRITVQSIMLAVMLLCCSFSCTRAQTPQWLPTNGPYGSTSNDFVVTPTGTFLLTDARNGIWRSTDSGAHWQRSSSGLANNSVESIAVLKDGTVMAGSYRGPCRSTNDGLSWQVMKTGMTSLEVEDIAVLTDGTVLAGVWNDGIYRSTNNGALWEQANNGLTELRIYCLFVTAAGHIYTGTYSGGAFRSTDGGDSWQQTALSGYIYDIAESPGGVLFASAGNSGVYRSTNSGDSWQRLSPSYSLNNGYGFAFFNETDILFGAPGARGISRSTDGGDSWSPFGQGFSLANTRSLHLTPGGDCYATTYGDGLYVLPKDSDTWRPRNEGQQGSQIRALETVPGYGIFAGGYSGVFVSRDGGGLWSYTDSSLGADLVSDLLYTHQTLYAATDDKGIRKSTDLGAHWLTANTGIGGKRTSCIAEAPDGRLYAGTEWDGIYTSSDQGGMWTAINEGLGARFVEDICTDASGTVYAGTDEGIYISTNAGANWSASLTGLSDNWAYCLLEENGRIYAGFSDGLYQSTNGGGQWSRSGAAQINSTVYALKNDASGAVLAVVGTECWRSADHGQTWVMIGGGLPSYDDASDIAVDEQGVLYTATQGKGVYKLTPGSTGVESGPPAVPQTVVLRQNVPNPCSARTSFIFELLHPEFVTLVVTDLLGRECARVLDRQDFAAGEHSIGFDVSMLNPGAYLYRLESGREKVMGKLVVIR